ncbi:chromosomal replication initiator protein DnaA [Oceanivirga miroungae]|uniref:Chromosomal replication initiator protein DnaA n=1 Tax=Oceanivirga miroungae TaxID=1130046 RepID=A0A6I8M4J1_9FUSO|nr:chromosomal replication initiator protein DnaA [Oceanivirga miroungae]VWL84824.1 chromosomal replication initiator protein DnaA [Oceanivirga miroungae]
MNKEKLANIFSIVSMMFKSSYGNSYETMLNQLSIEEIKNNICYLHTKNVVVANEFEEVKEKFLAILNNVLLISDIKIEDIVITREEKDYEIRYIDNNNEYIEEESFDTGLKEEFTMENFVAGKDPEFAYIVANQVIDIIVNDKKNVITPYLIYGASGLGKTHLGQAIGNAVLAKRPDKKVKYLTAEDFNNEFLEAIRRGNFKDSDSRDRSGSFRQKYRQLDLIIIDDIQFFERVFNRGTGSVEEEFFNTFNTLYLEKKQIVFISDRNPADIKNMQERIKTRIGEGVIVEMQRPDFSTRIAILKKYCEENNKKVNDRALEYIATHVDDSVRELQGTLKGVIVSSELLDKPIDIDLVKEVLERRKTIIKSKMTAESIVKKIAKNYEISVEEIKSQKRQKTILMPRQIAMYLIKTNLMITYDAIGKIFDRDHTTVMNAIKKIETQLEIDRDFVKELEELNRNIKD